MGERIYVVYILTNLHKTTLYVGVTNNLFRRIEEHKRGEGGVFSKEYHLNRLVYYEVYGDIRAAITREKQIKGQESGADQLTYPHMARIELG